MIKFVYNDLIKYLIKIYSIFLQISKDKIIDDRLELGSSSLQLLDWIQSLPKREQHIFSQNGEDGITLAIFERIGAGTKFFVEFGVETGVACNTRVLRYGHHTRGLKTTFKLIRFLAHF